jgi:GT2 family glycosyltransferase
VALLDDDDWWEDPEHLARVVGFYLGPGPRSPPQLHGFEEAGEEVRREVFELPTTPQSLKENNTVVASSLAYPRAFHDDLGPFDPIVGSYYDWDWLLRVLDAGYPISTIPTPGVCYTVHAGGASAVAANPTRLGFFERFREKHGLAVTIKNHASLLVETD